MSPLLEDVQRVHNMAGLSDRMITAATGAKPSTVRGWLAGRSEPTGAGPRVDHFAGRASERCGLHPVSAYILKDKQGPVLVREGMFCFVYEHI
jgi:hypothetical protein